MYIPQIPEIASFSEWMNLLVNMPEAQKRLKAIKEGQDILNQRIGDYELFTQLKGQQRETQAALADAKRIKAEAEVEAKKIKEKAFTECEKERARLDLEKAEFQRKAKELSDLEGRVNAQANANGLLGAQLEKKDQQLTALMKEMSQREATAKQTTDSFNAKRQKALEILA